MHDEKLDTNHNRNCRKYTNLKAPKAEQNET